MSKKKLLLIAGIVLIIGFVVGYVVGVAAASRFFVHMGLSLLELKGISLDIDEAVLSTAIWQYKNNIGGCLFANETG